MRNLDVQFYVSFIAYDVLYSTCTVLERDVAEETQILFCTLTHPRKSK